LPPLLSVLTNSVWVVIADFSVASQVGRGLSFYQFFTAADFLPKLSRSHRPTMVIACALCSLFSLAHFLHNVLTRHLIRGRVTWLDILLLNTNTVVSRGRSRWCLVYVEQALPK